MIHPVRTLKQQQQLFKDLIILSIFLHLIPSLRGALVYLQYPISQYFTFLLNYQTFMDADFQMIFSLTQSLSLEKRCWLACSTTSAQESSNSAQK